MRVDDHFVEALRAHRPGIKDDEAESIARDSLVAVGIPPTRERATTRTSSRAGCASGS